MILHKSLQLIKINLQNMSVPFCRIRSCRGVVLDDLRVVLLRVEGDVPPPVRSVHAQHCVHHQEGLHHYNYADLPVWDMLFGTFHNPRDWHERCGFGEKGHELLEMLRGHDVNALQEPA